MVVRWDGHGQTYALKLICRLYTLLASPGRNPPIKAAQLPSTNESAESIVKQDKEHFVPAVSRDAVGQQKSQTSHQSQEDAYRNTGMQELVFRYRHVRRREVR